MGSPFHTTTYIDITLPTLPRFSDRAELLLNLGNDCILIITKRSEGTEQPQAPLPPFLWRKEALAAFL
jgi:hypothetical protein